MHLIIVKDVRNFVQLEGVALPSRSKEAQLIFFLKSLAAILNDR